MFDNLTGKFHEVLYHCPMDPILNWSLLFILTVLELGAQRSSAKLVEHRYIEIWEILIKNTKDKKSRYIICKKYYPYLKYLPSCFLITLIKYLTGQDCSKTKMDSVSDRVTYWAVLRLLLSEVVHGYVRVSRSRNFLKCLLISNISIVFQNRVSTENAKC